MRSFLVVVVVAVAALIVQADEEDATTAVRRYYRQYLMLRAQGKLNEAITILKKIVELDPLIRGAWYEMACC